MIMLPQRCVLWLLILVLTATGCQCFGQTSAISITQFSCTETYAPANCQGTPPVCVGSGFFPSISAKGSATIPPNSYLNFSLAEGNPSATSYLVLEPSCWVGSAFSSCGN